MIILLALAEPIYSAYCSGKPGPVAKNLQPINEMNPRLLRTVRNGKLYEVGSEEYNTTTKLLHLYGSMYEMGFAQGELLKEELNSFFTELWEYILDQLAEAVPGFVPEAVGRWAVDKAAKVALDVTYHATAAWTSDKYYHEMLGLADASGAEYRMLRRVHMIGELTKGACSMFGAWGNATAGGRLIQLRALDWDFDGPYRKYATVTVYHPSRPEDGHAWVNIGFAGWLGVLSGVSVEGLAVSEIGVSFPDDTFGQESRLGNPFTFLLRDVLQFDRDLNTSLTRMQTTRRTCNLILGVGSHKDKEFRGVQYSHSAANIIAPGNLRPANDSWHPRVDQVVYWGMDWNCPSFSQRLSEMILLNYGNISAENTISSILPGTHTGNLQAVVYDLTAMKAYFAFGVVTPEGHHVDAFSRPFVRLDLDLLFQEQMSQSEAAA